MKDEILKARNVGDVHSNGKWIWAEYKPGKFDWRPLNAASSGSKPSSKITSKVVSKPMDSQKLAVWAKTAAEAALVKVANSKGNGIMRQIAYDELVERGYDVSTIDTSGTLGHLMKMTGNVHHPVDTSTPTDVQTDIDGEDEVTEKWYLNPFDERVKKAYNLKTKDGRVKYDKFLYKMKLKEPDYLSPIEVVEDLNEQYLNFLDNPEQRFMISAGGAGVGKTYGFKEIAKILNQRPFEEGDTAGDGDYDYFEATNVSSGKQLLGILKAHNGKTILFDDTDAVITRKDCSAIMKKATSSTGKRVVGDPDDVKTNFEFTGKIMIMTNKSLITLTHDNEDAKAIVSRAMMKSEIFMTVPETLQVMESRFQDFEFPEAARLEDEAEDIQEREKLLELIKKNKANIDPANFTTRTFQEMLNEKRKVELANKKRSNPLLSKLIGTSMKNWEVKAVALLTKADNDELGIPSDQTFEKAEEGEQLEIKFPDIEKAYEGDLTFDDMTLEKAEELLLED